MKKQLLAFALAAAPFVVFASGVHARDFQSGVADQTCRVSVNGDAAHLSVQLPTVSASALTTAGDTDGLTTFVLTISDCIVPLAVPQAISTAFAGNAVTTGGNLGGTGTATNVALQLLDPPSSADPVDFTASGGIHATNPVLQDGATSASHDLAVQYITEEGSASAGSVLNSVQYRMTYE
ncbi:fimbrial protein [Paraburkholderia dinghuensis]|uniref:Type 1 fimbrial protein n=1 Tax=Paraburkholderia dinghuensis TaxID=2305225 RepID=A0A3N6MLZ3_9BURK|nr:fimbrial protein [Paraburkholderia dinghuensis]RQH04729.1 type 1 fimbrial protein [Paraburkholderia dinghuensis]